MRALALLSHPSIVSVDDLGFLLDEEGKEITPYYLMPFLNGESLRTVLDRVRRFSPLEALNVTYQILGGVYAMHQAGIIHCDLKPDNVVVETSPARNARDTQVIKIIDFGVIFLMSNVARAGFFGTYPYASDNQLRGGTPTPADDLWGVCCILYQLLTGERPFADAKPGLEGAIGRIGTKPKPLREFGIDDPVLESLVEQGLDPDPRQRYQDARAMMRAVKLVWSKYEGANKPGAAHSSERSASVEGSTPQITAAHLTDPTAPDKAPFEVDSLTPENPLADLVGTNRESPKAKPRANTEQDSPASAPQRGPSRKDPTAIPSNLPATMKRSTAVAYVDPTPLPRGLGPARTIESPPPDFDDGDDDAPPARQSQKPTPMRLRGGVEYASLGSRIQNSPPLFYGLVALSLVVIGASAWFLLREPPHPAAAATPAIASDAPVASVAPHAVLPPVTASAPPPSTIPSTPIAVAATATVATSKPSAKPVDSAPPSMHLLDMGHETTAPTATSSHHHVGSGLGP